jgi:hypothetical protein
MIGTDMTYINEVDGVCSTVTKTKKGFVVCFIDLDVKDGIVHTQIFQDEKEANRQARYWIFQNPDE